MRPEEEQNYLRYNEIHVKKDNTVGNTKRTKAS
jgi:hypothetical protein